MSHISQTLAYLRARFGSDEGATMVEYGLIVALIAIAVVGAATLLGTEIGTLFGSAKDCLAGAEACPE